MAEVENEAAERPDRRTRLGRDLRALREMAGLSGRELAALVKISQSKVSRIESALAVPTLPEVARWCDVVGASDDRREMLITMTEAVFTEVRAWPAGSESRGQQQEEILQRELRARVVRTFEHTVVPGLLQTADYAKRLSVMLERRESHAVATLVAGRMDRQLALYDEERRFEFLVTEAALRWRPGPLSTLLAQLDRISSIATLENVRFGLIPQEAEAVVPVSHGFVIYSDHDGDLDAFVEAETVHANLIVSGSDLVDLYQERWSRLSEMALYGDEARKYLVDLAADLRVRFG